jgi:hypothetical protein
MPRPRSHQVRSRCLRWAFVNAWRSKEATTLLPVGGALIITAVVLTCEVDRTPRKTRRLGAIRQVPPGCRRSGNDIDDGRRSD